MKLNTASNSNRKEGNAGSRGCNGEHIDVIVVDVGGTSIRLGHLCHGLTSNQFDLINSDRLRVDNARRVFCNLILDYASRFRLKPNAVVMGLPGIVNRKTDSFTHCNNIPQLEGPGLKADFEQMLACEVIVEQDIMLQLLGEWRDGVALGSPSVFGVYFGTGIGAAYLVDGNPHHQTSARVQAGHIPIMAEGKPCLCGNLDCVEAYASGHTLVEMASTYHCPVEQLFLQQDGADSNTDPLTDLNAGLKTELDQFVLYQSYLIATLVTLVSPQTIVIGGGIPAMAAYPREQLVSNVRKHVTNSYPAERLNITWAELGTQSFLHGAMALLEPGHCPG